MIQGEYGPYLIEEKFNFAASRFISSALDNQLTAFTAKFAICDVQQGHNVQIIEDLSYGASVQRLGLYDFDCLDDSSLAVDKVVALYFGAILTTRLVKQVVGPKAAIGCKVIAIGTAASALAYGSIVDPKPDALVAAGIGCAMALTASVTACGLRSLCCLGRRLLPRYRTKTAKAVAA